MTRDELKNYILRQMGAPVLNVEITKEQLDDCINDSIQEIRPWYTVTRYATVDINGSTVNLLEYGIDAIEVTDVIPVDKSFADNGSSYSQSSDPLVVGFKFSNAFSFGSNSYMFHNAMINRASHLIASRWAQMNSEKLYNYLANIANEKMNGTLLPQPSWKLIGDTLYVDVGEYNTNVITIEYIPNIRDVSDIEDRDEDNSRYTRFLKELSLAFAQRIQSLILKKHQITGAPNTVNGDAMSKDATQTISRIREELRKSTMRFYITK